MTIDEKNKIIHLREEGLKVNEISKLLNLPFYNVKYIYNKSKVISFSRCMNCGGIVENLKKHKKKKFCSDKCRNEWWKEHQELVKRKANYLLVCKQCGKEFVSYGDKNQKFCSRKCYADYRRK